MILPKVDIKRILYATDLSESARHAFAYAISLANLYGASITLLHTLDETPEMVDKCVVGYIGAERWEEIKKQHYQEARESLVGKKRAPVPIREVLDQFCAVLNYARGGEIYNCYSNIERSTVNILSDVAKTPWIRSG